MDCNFCKIASHVATASRVYEDDRVMAFMGLAPISYGHLLVVPKKHVARLASLDPEDGARMMAVAKQLVQALYDSELDADGVNLHLADGEAAFQDVAHTHLHVIPRKTGDGSILIDDYHEPGREVLDNHAKLIRDRLEQV